MHVAELCLTEFKSIALCRSRAFFVKNEEHGRSSEIRRSLRQEVVQLGLEWKTANRSCLALPGLVQTAKLSCRTNRVVRTRNEQESGNGLVVCKRSVGKNSG